MKLIPVLFLLTFSISLCNLSERFGSKNGNSNSRGSSSSSSDLPPADKPAPTAAQTAAIAGGQQVTWSEQGITWTVPANWSKVSVESKSFNWKSPGSDDAAFLIGSISPMSGDFPTDNSIKAMYDSSVTRQKNGEVSEVRWLELDGLRGVQTMETPPETKDGIRRLQWQGYRKYAGQVQLVNLILSTQGQHFHMHEDELYGILFSTKLVHD